MIWLLLVLGIGVAVYFLFIRKTAASQNAVTFNGVKCSHEAHQTTPKGVNVYSVAGLPSSSLVIIDDSLTTLFMDCIAEGYKDRILDYNFFNLYIPVEPCMPSPEWKTPGFVVHDAVGYDQSVYDIDSRIGVSTILAAELVIDPAAGSYIVCPDASDLAEATRVGAEHLLIFANDSEYYERSKVHTTINHRLIPRNNR